MIQRLRRKFVLINMALVSAVLLFVVGGQALSDWQTIRAEVDGTLFRAVSRKESVPPPFFEMDRVRPKKGEYTLLPVFAVIGEGDTLTVMAQNAQVSQELATLAAQEALGREEHKGVLGNLGLRYLVQQAPDGVVRIAFTDLDWERSELWSILGGAVLSLFGGLFGFFAVSLYLSRWALRPVERAWEQQRRFVADASHELKTPLTVILANTGILLAHPQETVGEQKKWVENTRAEAARMKKLVDDLLFLAKADAVSAPREERILDFSELVFGATLPFEPVAFEAGVTLESEIEPGLWVRGDEGELRQLVAILLDNACKYAVGGRVSLALSCTGERMHLAVNNSGEPIDAGQLAHIFERFYRVDGSRARKQGGYGLGLSIAQRIAERHKGSISADSSRERGTTFTVVLPRAVPAGAATEKQA